MKGGSNVTRRGSVHSNTREHSAIQKKKPGKDGCYEPTENHIILYCSHGIVVECLSILHGNLSRGRTCGAGSVQSGGQGLHGGRPRSSRSADGGRPGCVAITEAKTDTVVVGRGGPQSANDCRCRPGRIGSTRPEHSATAGWKNQEPVDSWPRRPHSD